MAKKLIRFNTPGSAHGLSFTCYRNRRFLSSDRTRLYFAEALQGAGIKHNFDLWAYVVMPEHVHLVIFPGSEIYSISAILKSIKQPVARRAINYLRKHESGILRFMETGLDRPRWHFWQNGGGYDRNIRDCRELERLVNYVHENPVRRGLVRKAEDWCWSSARDWVHGTDEGPIFIERASYPIM